MLKKIITFLFFFLFVFASKTFAISIPIEQVFVDIDKNYKYYNELQTLYDKGMISPDNEGKFNPKKLLNRDEFVGIMMEVSCEKCISPNVSYDLFKKYNNVELFFDINKTNKYFYCIAGADYNGYVKGYDAGTKCENGDFKEGERPFCPKNTIILEEALAVILRASGILTNSEADIIRMKIASGQITQNLADDVSPKNVDGSIYSFYPDFQKALDYELVEYDKNGTQKIYKMVEIVDGKLRPKQAISKEDFLRIAYVSLKGNSCNLKKSENLGLQISIFNKSCTEGNIKNCSVTSLNNNEKIYDFYGNVSSPYGDKISNDNSYIWRFYNLNTGEEIIKYGQYIDNYDFLKDGDYKVFFRAISDNGNTSEIYNDIKIFSGNAIRNNLEINYNNQGNNTYNFTGLGSSNIVKYEWDYGDGTKGIGTTTTKKYTTDGLYKVTLIGTTSDNKKIEKVVYIDTRNNLEINYNNQGNNTYNFTGLGSSNIVKYEWDYGDGTKGTGTTTTKKYTTDGLYKVTLIGTTSDNKKIEKVVYIDTRNNLDNSFLKSSESNNKLSINANPFFGNTPLVVNFSSIFFGNTNQASYNWDFGDGTSSFGKNSEHIYKESGVYKVTLSVKDNLGEISISTVNILVFNNNLNDTDGDGVDDSEDYEKNTSYDKILYICTKEDISNKRYDCKSDDMLGVYSSVKKSSDTDGDGVDDNEDYEKNTPYDKILYICIKEDISNKRYDCKSDDMLGVYSSKKENSLIGDTDGDGVNDLIDACPQIEGVEENKGCPIFDKSCNLDSDCSAGFYCNSGVCSPKQITKNCEYTGGDLITGNVVCNSCPCNNFIDFNASLRACDVVFPAIVSPDNKTIYSKGNYFQIR